MREFVVYTLLRLLLLVATFAVVAGIWLAVSSSVSLLWSLVISFVVSGVASLFLLNPQRASFARRVDERARRATARFEEMRAREDVD